MRPAYLLLVTSILALAAACSATSNPNDFTGDGSGAAGSTGHGGAGGAGGAGADCDVCFGNAYTPCVNGEPGQPVECPDACAHDLGCVACVPGSVSCVGNEVHQCTADGANVGPVIQVCDVAKGEMCGNGHCSSSCDLAAEQPSNVGCEFWAVDLDQQDGMNDPASAPWGVVISNAGEGEANVTIEINAAPPGQPLQIETFATFSVAPNALVPVQLPTRELDCGTKPNDYASPGTCLSSNAYRITSTGPILAYQFNVFANAYSNDASLLLPTNALGKLYRVIGWGAGHPIPMNFPGMGLIIDRSYVTIVGTKPNTVVTVNPSWRIKGNAPIAATAAGGLITATLGPFDVLNLETDDATTKDDPKTMADLSGSVVQANQPVAVFSGVETTSAPGGVVDIPTPPGWADGDTCCLDHLEDQMFPMESIGTHYVIARSPIRSTGSFREADIIRFVGVAETAIVTTSLAPPFDQFTILPGEVKTTWTQDNFVATSDKPVMIGQILVSNGYVDGPAVGDPSLTVMPPVEQYRSDYVILQPDGWSTSWVVIAAEVGSAITLDGNLAACTTEPAGAVEGKTYESRRCQLSAGVHRLNGDKPFGIVAYGYGSAGSYAFAGGAAVKRIYEPPPIK
jgi:hypothetical protein